MAIKLTPPLGIERDYQKRIRKIVKRTRDIIYNNIVINLPNIMGQVNAARRTDGIGEDVHELFVATRLEVESAEAKLLTDRMVQGTAQEINTWNKTQVTAAIKSSLGIDIFIAEPWLAEQLIIWTTNNVNLITNVNQAFVSDTERIVLDGMAQGTRHEEIAKQIMGTGLDEKGRVSAYRIAKNRANLIGRDQVNKLNGQLTELRQTSIGVKKYIWRTVGDPRVRDSHSSRDGQTYSWKKGSEIGTHPGEEIQCRCYAEAILDDLLK